MTYVARSRREFVLAVAMSHLTIQPSRLGRNQLGLRAQAQRISRESTPNADSNLSLTIPVWDGPIQTRAVSKSCVSIPTPLHQALQSSAENPRACVRWYPTRKSPTAPPPPGDCALRLAPNSMTCSPVPPWAKGLRGSDGIIFRTAERTLPESTFPCWRLSALSTLDVCDHKGWINGL
jgi:hypothetical protein